CHQQHNHGPLADLAIDVKVNSRFYMCVWRPTLLEVVEQFAPGLAQEALGDNTRSEDHDDDRGLKNAGLLDPLGNIDRLARWQEAANIVRHLLEGKLLRVDKDPHGRTSTKAN